MGKSYKDLVKEYCGQEFKFFVKCSLDCSDVSMSRYYIGRAITFKQIIDFLDGSDLFEFQCNHKGFGIYEKRPIIRTRNNTK